MRISDWSSDVCSSYLIAQRRRRRIGIGVIDDKFHNAAYYASDYESSMTPRLKSTFLASGTVILRWAESAAVSSAATTSAMPEKLRSIRARIDRKSTRLNSSN